MVISGIYALAKLNAQFLPESYRAKMSPDGGVPPASEATDTAAPATATPATTPTAPPKTGAPTGD